MFSVAVYLLNNYLLLCVYSVSNTILDNTALYKTGKTPALMEICSTEERRIINKHIGKFVICWVVINAMKMNEAQLEG